MQVIDTIQVPVGHRSHQFSNVTLNGPYTMVITGQTHRQLGPDFADYDAFYCFDSSALDSPCKNPERSREDSALSFADLTSTTIPDLGDLQTTFDFASDFPYPTFNDPHSYEVPFVATAGTRLHVVTWATKFPGDGYDLSGSFTIQIRGEVPKPTAREKEILKCKRTITKASAAYLTAGTTAIAKCSQAVHAGKLPPETDCITAADTRAALEKADEKLHTAIAKACGGPEKDCDSEDTLDPEDVGFPTPCPGGLSVTGCVQPIDDCSDMATCLACIGDASLRVQANLLGAVRHANPKGTREEKVLHKCQKAVLKGATTYVRLATTALAKCWDTRFKGKHSNVCPFPGDGKAAAALGDAAGGLEEKICTACLAVDPELCDRDAETVTPEQIFGAPTGFVCPTLTTPEDDNCERPVSDLEDLTECLGCVGNFVAGCASRSSVPSLAGFPFLCKQ